jgi:hypothetical protein
MRSSEVFFFNAKVQRVAKNRKELIRFMSSLLPELFDISRPNLAFFANLCGPLNLCVKE